MKLKDFFKEYPKIAIGFSGGVDSSYLLYAAVLNGAEVTPYFVKTAFQPEFEYDDAAKVCGKLGINMKVINLDILAEQKVRENPSNRCYYCKGKIFGAIAEQARKDGIEVLIDGTNASDDVADRAGFAAITELKVLSPLRLCGLTKDRIRELSKEAGIHTWDKPAYACLATRIPSGTEITADMLKKIETAEDILMGMGFKDFRVRLINGAAKLELTAADMERLILQREAVLSKLGGMFSEVMLNLKGR